MKEISTTSYPFTTPAGENVELITFNDVDRPQKSRRSYNLIYNSDLDDTLLGTGFASDLEIIIELESRGFIQDRKLTISELNNLLIKGRNFQLLQAIWINNSRA